MCDVCKGTTLIRKYINGSIRLIDCECYTPTDEPIEATPSWGSFQQVENNHGNIGKVWMINHIEQKRARVNENEVDGMIELGYKKGGPKTQFKGI